MLVVGGHHGASCLHVLVRVGRHGTTVPMAHDAPAHNAPMGESPVPHALGSRQGRHGDCHTSHAPSAGHDTRATVLGAHAVGETPSHSGDLPMGWTLAWC